MRVSAARGIARSAGRFFGALRPRAGGAKSRPVSVGIDIGYSQVNLVKAARSHAGWEILEYRSIPIPGGVEKGSGEFDEFLKSAVLSFCGHPGVRTWSIISSAQAQVQMVRIPKVSGKHFEAALHWSLKKELAFDENNYALGYEIQGEAVEEDGRKNNVLCYFAPIEEIEAAKGRFSAIGVPLAGASIAPFAVQNIFSSGITARVENLIACLFIGNGHSRIDLYTGGKLTLTRDIKTGINSMIEIVMEDLNGRTEGGHSLSRDEARKILFDYARGGDGPELPEDVPRAGVGGIIEPVLERFARQMERTFKHLESTQGYGRVEKLYVSSIMPCEAVTGYFGEQLGIPCAVFDPLREVLSGNSLDERALLIPAFGIALSDSRTPNFIHSNKEKREEAHIARVNRAILAFMAASFLVCAAVTAYEWYGAVLKKAELAGIERQLQKSPPLTRELIIKMASAARQRAREYAEFSQRYRGVALIGVLSNLTPSSVSLTSLRVNFGDEAGGRKIQGVKGNNGNNKGGAAAGDSGSTVVKGVIGGDEAMLEPALASYVVDIKSSPFFSGVSVQTGKIGHARRGAFLPFVIDLKMGGDT